VVQRPEISAAGSYRDAISKLRASVCPGAAPHCDSPGDGDRQKLPGQSCRARELALDKAPGIAALLLARFLPEVLASEPAEYFHVTVWRNEHRH
jgi:hypothetical protein